MTNLVELQATAASWMTCRECGLKCNGPLGLHRHIRARHEMSAWAYYQRHPEVLLFRALDGSDVVDAELVHFAGPCWVHRGKPDRWGARLRVAGAPTSALYRLTYWAVHGELPHGYACHVCDNPQCCSPLHVWDGSPSDNARDREDKGRGYDRRKLDDRQAERLRRLHHSGLSYRELGRRFNVGAETARRVVVGSTYPRTQAPSEPSEPGDEIPW
ncbi:MAG: hypothetical protein K0V04_20190 [Deltaproteobacteria bacterium]|nr:hypothetical protein [Deltaproteobacteria bacterium]